MSCLTSSVPWQLTGVRSLPGALTGLRQLSEPASLLPSSMMTPSEPWRTVQDFREECVICEGPQNNASLMWRDSLEGIACLIHACSTKITLAAQGLAINGLMNNYSQSV